MKFSIVIYLVHTYFNDDKSKYNISTKTWKSCLLDWIPISHLFSQKIINSDKYEKNNLYFSMYSLVNLSLVVNTIIKTCSGDLAIWTIYILPFDFWHKPLISEYLYLSQFSFSSCLTIITQGNILVQFKVIEDWEGGILIWKLKI